VQKIAKIMYALLMKKDRDGELFTMGLIKHRLTFFEGNLPTVTTPLLLLNLQIQPSLSIF
jgi:hypothetical protein